MNQTEKLMARREAILQELSGIEQMRRGSVMEQYVETVRADGGKGRRGPYFLYTFKEKKKTISRRITRRDLVPAYRNQIEAFRRFTELVSELTAIGEKLGDLSIAQKHDVKKTKNSRLRSKSR
jgi:hypothetical protein